ncbi:MAG: gamma-glutamylcyclotransferase [Devosia sp.]|uniref:gamma-glutamylcyclotransferase n=1 Tax=Devosia sp. TaxID=1871048 RepID=UPI001AC7D8D8|nr:gamma-glutamylcyclotransferase [Devosia sp.]MBN9315144.1 gamma-glutamylcyclotransferase [Devosia sp.]
MPPKPRPLHLTSDHVARIPVIEDPGPPNYAFVRLATDADYDAEVERWISAAPGDDFWIFAYGSLIWNPATDTDAEKIAVARGWHRSFCLFDQRYRGNPKQPGLMLCLDRGGTCRGVAYRIPAARLRENLHKLIRREMSMVPSAFPARWIKVMTETGPLTTLAFIIDRRDQRYIGGLSLAERADQLAQAHGWKGSMAEYVLSTVTRLEELGIHDRNLWQIQRLVAERIEHHWPR